jgi:hypothetical protein
VEKLFLQVRIDCGGLIEALRVSGGAAPETAQNEGHGEKRMRDILKSAVLALAVFGASVAHAGGPVIIEEGNNEVIEEKTVRSAGILPVLGMLVLVCLVACGGGGDDPAPVEEK